MEFKYKKLRLISFSVLFLSLTLNSQAQTAQEIVRSVDKKLHQDFPDYHQLEIDLLDAKSKDPKDLDVDYMLSIVMLEQDGKLEAIEYIRNVISSGNYLRDFDFYLAYLEHRKQNFDEAIASYQKFKSKLNKDELEKAQVLSLTKYLISKTRLLHASSSIEMFDMGNIIDNRISQCQNAKTLTKTVKKVKITNLGWDINTSFDEYSPVYSLIDSTLYFTSRRPIPDHLMKDENDELYLEHIFESKIENGIWSKSKYEDEPLNSFTHNVSALAINRDGNDIFIFDYRNNGDIMHSTRISDGKWTEPTEFSSNFNSSRVERSFAISDDGKLVVLERDGITLLDRDLFYSTFNGTSWSELKSMGSTINTPFPEDGVFLHNHGKTLYFSSKGHNSMGGYDIFKTEWKDTAWTKPVNLGYPINSVYDDIYFIISDDEKYAFFSSNRPGGNGGVDIYHIDLKPLPESQEIIVKIIDSDNGSYLRDANVVLVDKVSGEEYKMKRMPDGTYETYVPNKENHGKYSIVAKKPNFGGASLDFEIADTLERKMVGSLSLKEIKAEIVKFVFNDVYLFDVNSSNFFEKYHSRLQILVDALKENQVTILIEGHTDNTSNDKYNQKLSEKRAEEVRQYLIAHGAKPEQIITKGYGESKPLNDNSTKELRDLNRRVEVSLVE